MKTIALVACVKDKLDHPAPAKDLYQGNLFNSWLQDIKNRNISEYYILSGKYGLLLADEIIEPYDLNLGEQSQEFQSTWSENVLKRLNNLVNLENVHVVIYTNPVYYRELIFKFKSFEVPFEID